ncbi:histidine-type phosphatase [Corynebacterium sp. CNCTC7651]|uniref:histidine-type phosphatase n=1 Tax=Corynebacterium sp. CNCTC7651 TaxID=2815361 RepID=UPI00351D4C13
MESAEPKYVGRGDQEKTVTGVVDAALQFYNLYIIAPAMENEAAKPAEGWIFDQYMDDQDGPTFAYLLDVEDYYEKGPAIEGQTVAYDNFVPLLEHMINGVKDRASGGKVAAEYRFGHAETIIPLAALLKLPGSQKGVPADQVMDYSNSDWRGDRVSPMAANIQWDAFQNAEGVTLVRMLYNEAEIPFHAGCMPVMDDSTFYYRRA